MICPFIVTLVSVSTIDVVDIPLDACTYAEDDWPFDDIIIEASLLRPSVDETNTVTS